MYESPRSLSGGPLRVGLGSLPLRRPALRTRTRVARQLASHDMFALVPRHTVSKAYDIRRRLHAITLPSDPLTLTLTLFQMENLTKSHLWLAAAALVAACGVCAGAGVGRKPFTPTDSILDIIDTQKVERILAERRRAEQATASSTSYVQRNELGDGSSEGGMVESAPDQDESTELPSGSDFRKMLKSSKSALLVTKKEYLKEDWCKTEPLIQKIREPGCLPATVVNKFCYGQCNSFYIPKGPRRRDNAERPQPAFKSCSFCRPKNFTWITVTLRCPGQNPPYRRKRLQKVKQCRCLSVGVN